MTDEQGALFPDAARKKKRKRDYIFEALREVCGYKARLCNWDRGRLNAAAAQLKEKGLTNDSAGAHEVRTRARIYRKWLAGKTGGTKQPHQIDVCPPGLVRCWDQCLAAEQPTIQPGQPSRKELEERRREQAEWDARHPRRAE